MARPERGGELLPGAPAYVWYIDNEGREVKRPYEG
nr:MAG TPA: hypothetical protein [Caudoviricetes sp.]